MTWGGGGDEQELGCDKRDAHVVFLIHGGFEDMRRG